MEKVCSASQRTLARDGYRCHGPFFSMSKYPTNLEYVITPLRFTVGPLGIARLSMNMPFSSKKSAAKNWLSSFTEKDRVVSGTLYLRDTGG